MGVSKMKRFTTAFSTLFIGIFFVVMTGDAAAQDLRFRADDRLSGDPLCIPSPSGPWSADPTSPIQERYFFLTPAGQAGDYDAYDVSDVYSHFTLSEDRTRIAAGDSYLCRGRIFLSRDPENPRERPRIYVGVGKITCQRTLTEVDRETGRVIERVLPEEQMGVVVTFRSNVGGHDEFVITSGTDGSYIPDAVRPYDERWSVCPSR